MAGIAMDDSWHVRRYVPAPDAAAVRGIVGYLGQTLWRPESATVDAADPAERIRLREAFLKRRLRLTLPDAELDAAITDVLTTMSRDRVAVCYLLAHRFGKLPLFVAP